ncbi:NUDIX hydrolase [Methylocella sp. CPCC 101449]|jgi:8-oxo-dGTP pyrophosphatase MutT (NUDIX family)|uniref:NUDIX hydrolase n=1 Tax=Methylocella sp. CPCC 101449 TaxID=2987531 RepID=UPI002891F461|nr:NUDIX hydrolase [Methylocella sp. CPCC 101449]MDT2019789.1 NUDIX hydrolase [Methylocella sp. CPCC 101449]HEV2575305.1 NUDIX hydrolase [Beijerinckiaceae bacterium]
MATSTAVRTTQKNSEPHLQFAALPYRLDNGLEVMLVSSLDSGRWIIPKGWPMDGLTGYETAAREAFEEAGLIGNIASKSIGQFHYQKRRKNGAVWLCRVEVFPMEVTQQRKKWPEKHDRSTKWFSVEQAAELVREDELAEVMRQFAAMQRVPQG